MRRRFFIIHNPYAGSSARRLYDATVSRILRSGSNIEVVETARHGEGMKVAANAAQSGRFDAIVAAGGDGTVHDVAEALIDGSIPLGIIPTGTANVFAREIGLPNSVDAIAKTLLEGKVRTLPVGRVNGRIFLFVVGIGFDAEAVRFFEREGTRNFGQVGLVWPVLRALASYRDRSLIVRTDRGETQAHWVIVTRAKHYAGNLLLTPEADLQKRQLFVLCMGGSGLFIRLRQLSAFMFGNLWHEPSVAIERTNFVRIDGDELTPVQIDGEALGQLPLEISLHPNELSILCTS